jgi:hypothetical protein
MLGVQGLGGDVDDPRAGIAQANQGIQQPLFVVVDPFNLLQLRLIEGQGRHDHHMALAIVKLGGGSP